jgi:hypothetical protein
MSRIRAESGKGIPTVTGSWDLGTAGIPEGRLSSTINGILIWAHADAEMVAMAAIARRIGTETVFARNILIELPLY